MHHYSVFGGCLRSELEFPDLSPTTSQQADWTVRLAPEPPLYGDGIPLGEQVVGHTRVCLFRTLHGFRLQYASLGSAWISEDGSLITWQEGHEGLPEFTRAVLLGPALALALHQNGVLCLHGSAVALNGMGVAFLAPKFHGKSTLAFALVAAGAKLLSDDALAIDLAPVPAVRPGVHSIRLWPDSAEQLRVSELAGRVVAGFKQTVADLPSSRLAQYSTPLAAVYLLQPIESQVGQVRTGRRRLRTVPATVSLARNTKLVDPLIGYLAAGAQLRWAGSLARAVPVYSLRMGRRFEHLGETVDRLLAWHGTRHRVASLIAVGAQ